MSFLKFAIVLTTISTFVMPASSQAKSLSPQAVQCRGQLFNGKAKYNEEISGIKCIAQGGGQASCFIVTDEKKGLQQLTISQSNIGYLSCSPGPVLAKKRGLSCLKGKKAERDFEGIASDQTALFITGSWGNQRKKSVAPSPERWALIRQKLRGVTGVSDKCQRVKRKDLMTILKNAGGDIAKFIDAPLQCGGVNLEGLAYQNGKLFFGLRSPSFFSMGAAWVISASASPLFNGDVAAANVQRHTLNFKVDGKAVKGVGIRGLEPLGKHQLLVVTGPAGVSNESINSRGQELIQSKCNAPPFYKNEKIGTPFALWIWTPKTGRLQHLGNIAGQYGNQKLESVAVISLENKTLTLVLSFDGVNNDEMSPLAQLSIDLP